MVFEKVRKAIVEVVSVDESEVTPESNILDDLGADSLDIIEIVIFMEEELDIEIPDSEIYGYKSLKFSTVQDLVSIIEKIQAKGR